MKYLTFSYMLLFFLTACTSEEPVNLEYAPGTIIIGLNPDTEVADIFKFINEIGLETKDLSHLRFDELQDKILQMQFLETINNQPFIESSGWPVKVQVYDREAQATCISPRLFFMHNKDFQASFLEIIDEFELKRIAENGGVDIGLIFHVNNGEEESWVEKLKNHEIVEYAHLNYIFTSIR